MNTASNNQRVHSIIEKAFQEEGCTNTNLVRTIQFLKETQGEWFYVGALIQVSQLTAGQIYCVLLTLERHEIVEIRYEIHCPQCGRITQTAKVFNELSEWSKCGDCAIGFTALENTFFSCRTKTNV